MVSDLFLAGTKQWNKQLIKEIFWEEEADQILHTPISQVGREDKMVWNFTKNGFFWVKSAYHTTIFLNRNQQGKSSQSRKPDLMWKTLWNLRISNKSKNFMWQVCTNSLPTKEKLVQEGLYWTICVISVTKEMKT